MRIFRKFSLALTLAMTVTGLFGAAAFAHECFIADRSEQGVQAAGGHSDNWFVGTTDDVAFFYYVMTELGKDPFMDELTPGEAAAAGAFVATWSEAFAAAVHDAGLPTSIAIFEHHTIGTNPRTGEPTPAYTKNGRSNDGHGVEHFFSGGYIDEYFGLLAGVCSC